MSEIGKFAAVMITLMMTGLVGYAGVTIINAFQRRTRRPELDVHPGEIEEIRAQLAELEPLRARVSELEDRLDFTERLLARHQEPPRIEGGAPSAL
jgi:hypothetical protein